MFAKLLLSGCILGAILLVPSIVLGQIPSAKELLTKSIAYHDPANTWDNTKHELTLSETRPGGSDRQTSLIINLPKSYFSSNRSVDGNKIQQIVTDDDVQIKFNGEEAIDSPTIEKYRLVPERSISMRNYYTYLWGLPMKLHDPGTIIDETIASESFNGLDAWKMKVTYDPAVGNDIWYFYFAKESSALIGYRFYHDESANDGEYIILEGEAPVGELLLPARRSWYMHKDDKYLGSDEIK